jgi:hypothetical protein
MFRKDVQETHDDKALAFFSSNGRRDGAVAAADALPPARLRSGPLEL